MQQVRGQWPPPKAGAKPKPTPTKAKPSAKPPAKPSAKPKPKPKPQSGRVLSVRSRAGKASPGSEEGVRKAPPKRPPAGKAPAGKPPSRERPKQEEQRPGSTTRARQRVQGLVKRPGKRLRTFKDLGWWCGEREEELGADALALDLGVESLCVSSYQGSLERAKDQAQPTMILVSDAHAFRTLEPFSLEVGLPALMRWPSERVLRGTHGSLLLPSQIGLVEFPATHALAGLVGKLRGKRKLKQVVLSLPTFLSSEQGRKLRALVAPTRKGAFAGVPSAIGAAAFYLAPALSKAWELEQEEPAQGPLSTWSEEALERGRLLVFDWGASGLEYGLVGCHKGPKKTDLRLRLAGTWPSLGGHRLTLELVLDLREAICERLLACGPSEDLVQRPLFRPGSGQVPRPLGYEEAFRELARIGEPSDEEEGARVRQLKNLLFPTAWRFSEGQEPEGFAPYRRLAVQHFKALWNAAERIKRLVFSDPARQRKRKTIPWSLERIDSPFVSDLDVSSLDYPVELLLERVETRMHRCLSHVGARLNRRGVKRGVHVGLCGMQAAGPLLREAVGALAARNVAAARGLHAAEVAPTSSDPLELKAVVNRGASLLSRERKQVDFGTLPEVFPFSVEIADCLGNVPIFSAGTLDELAVFQRRIRVEDGSPQYEFLLYSSEDGTQAGSWGRIDFSEPFDFTAEDRAIALDPRYGFGSSLPTLRELRGDGGTGLQRCFDRGTPGWTEGSISFRAYAPRGDALARRLLHFLEHGLKGSFHRKVFLLEREFLPPPMRHDYVYQRYYLSRSQELLVVREWWTPVEGGKLMRNKTLHTCQGSTEANTILGLNWGTY